MSDSIFHTVLDLVDNIKTKLTDQEYKKIAESIADAKSKHIPEFYRIRYRLVSTHMNSSSLCDMGCEGVDSLFTTTRDGLALCELTDVPARELNPFYNAMEDDPDGMYSLGCKFDTINKLTMFGIMNKNILRMIKYEINERGYSSFSCGGKDRNHHKNLTIFSIKEKEMTKK